MAHKQDERASEISVGSGSLSSAAGPKRSRARSWGRGCVWVIAVYWTGVGLLAALATKSGLYMFQSELMAFPYGAVLLAWLIVGEVWRRRWGVPLPFLKAFGVVLVAALAADLFTGTITGFTVLVGTEAVLSVWSVRIAWRLRPLLRAFESESLAGGRGGGPIGSLSS